MDYGSYASCGVWTHVPYIYICIYIYIYSMQIIVVVFGIHQWYDRFENVRFVRNASLPYMRHRANVVGVVVAITVRQRNHHQRSDDELPLSYHTPRHERAGRKLHRLFLHRHPAIFDPIGTPNSNGIMMMMMMMMMCTKSPRPHFRAPGIATIV